MENWKPIIGFEGYYLVSNLGEIKRIKEGKSTKIGKILKPAICNGYKYVGLSKNGKLKIKRIHKIVADTFLGICPKGKEVDHINRNKSDNRLENLRYITHTENTHNTNRYKGIKKVLTERGLKNKRIETKLESIKKDVLSGNFTYRKLGQKYNIHYSTISRWVNRNRRSDLFQTS